MGRKKRKKVAYSYIRCSRPEQLKGDSLRRQKEASRLWCERNGFVLDTSLRLEDHGYSAFTGDNVLKGKLGAFIQAIEDGRVESGSVLIVESLDRLSRQAIGTALALFINLIENGITIITLNPEENFSKESINDSVKLIIAIIILSRAYEESAIKASRLKDAWQEKRKALYEDGKKLTGRTPCWIKLIENEFEFDEEAAAVVRRIVGMYVDGMGVDSIARTLNREQVPTLGKGRRKGKMWRKSTILKFLHNKALIGEFQPHLGRSNKSKRTPIGEAIPDYFPPLITEDCFYKVQKRLAANPPAGRRGSGGGSVANLFTRLVMDARDGSTMVIVDKGKRGAGRQLVSSAAKNGNGKYVAFNYCAFETAVLKMIKSVSPSDILPKRVQNRIEKHLAALNVRLGKTNSAITKIQAQLEGEDVDESFVEALLPSLKKLTDRRKTIEEEIATSQAELHSALPSHDDCIQLVDLVQGEHPDKQTYRSRLRILLQELISRIDTFVIAKGHWRQCYAQISFASGHQRVIVINTHRKRLVSHGGFDLALPLTSEESQKHLESRLDEIKQRSVQETEGALFSQLIGAAVGQSGTVYIGADSLSHEKDQVSKDHV